MSNKKIDTESQQIAIAHVQIRLEEVFMAVQQKLNELKSAPNPNQDGIAIAKIRLDTLAKLLGLLVEPVREAYERFETFENPPRLAEERQQQEKLIAAILQGL